MNSPIQPGRTDRRDQPLAAIVLAAGYSSRMVEFKPLLPLGGVTALERCIGVVHGAEIDEVIAVLGHRANELRPLAEKCGARCTVNPQFDRGMFSSIIAGCRAVPQWTEAAFVLPVDTPLVRTSTIRRLAAAWITNRVGIVYPVFDGHRGHPPLIARDILDEAAQGAKGPLSALLARHESRAIDVLVADEAIHLDMDTRADYDTLAALAVRRAIPTKPECEAILAGQEVDARIIRHSRKVAKIAVRLAAALLHCGHEIDPDLAQAGALLHDVAKGQSNHAAVGASILSAMGFDRVAEIVAAHTDLGGFRKLDESAIVYLADKLVRREEPVTLEERFAPAFTRFRKDSAALLAARRRLADAKSVLLAVEKQTGARLATLLSDETNGTDRIPGRARAHEVETA